MHINQLKIIKRYKIISLAILLRYQIFPYLKRKDVGAVDF